MASAFSKHKNRIGLALLIAVALVAAALFLVTVGENTFVYNDATVPATVRSGAVQVIIAPNTWGTIRLASGGVHEVSASFPDGTKTTFTANLKHRPDFPNARAYSTTGTHCFALIDVSSVYGSSADTHPKLVKLFSDTQVMEEHHAFATLIDPGPLPAEFSWNRQYDTLLWFTPSSCDKATVEQKMTSFGVRKKR